MVKETMKNKTLTLAYWSLLGVVVVVGIAAIYVRVVQGLRVTNLTSLVPWGLWVAFYIYFIGLSAGSFLISTMIYVFGLKRFEPIGRTALFAAFIALSINESRVAERQRRTTLAFHIAEAGIERALYDLRQDFINDADSPSWADGDINGLTIGPDTTDFYSTGYGSTSLNSGSYAVQLKNVSGISDAIWIRSPGTLGDVQQTI